MKKFKSKTSLSNRLNTNKSNRRQLLLNTLSGLAGVTIAPKLFANTSHQQLAEGNENILISVFLRGGMDGLSVVYPKKSTGKQTEARRRYETYRENNNAGTRLDTGITLDHSELVLHPSFSPLESMLEKGEFKLIAGAGAPIVNRSHFRQMDLIESSSSTGVPLASGVYGRALSEFANTAALDRLSLQTRPVFSLRNSISSGLTARDLERFGKVEHPVFEMSDSYEIRERVANYLSCESDNRFCRNAEEAITALQMVEEVVDRGDLPSVDNQFSSVLHHLGSAINLAPEAFRIIAVDFGGWDTHFDQGNAETGRLQKQITALSAGLKVLRESIDDAIWSRVRVHVVTEFGRTTRQNGTGGTDHGYGSVQFLLGQGFETNLLADGYFPDVIDSGYYQQAEANNYLPKLVDVRQIYGELIRDHLGLSDRQALARVIPDYGLSSSRILV